MSVIECNSEEFNNVYLKSKKPILVDFNATWCGPCRMMEPILEEVSEKNKEYDFLSVDVDQNNTLASTYGIMSIPCLVVIKDGKEVKRNVGFISKEELEEFLGD